MIWTAAVERQSVTTRLHAIELPSRRSFAAAKSTANVANPYDVTLAFDVKSYLYLGQKNHNNIVCCGSVPDPLCGVSVPVSPPLYIFPSGPRELHAVSARSVNWTRRPSSSTKRRMRECVHSIVPSINTHRHAHSQRYGYTSWTLAETSTGQTQHTKSPKTSTNKNNSYRHCSAQPLELEGHCLP